MVNEHVLWLLKVLQPERTLASLPGGGRLGPEAHAGLLGLPVETYASELARLRGEASDAAAALLADPEVAEQVDRLPLARGARVVVFGDSLTSEPQSWAVILGHMLAMRRGADAVAWTISAVAGETTTHALVRLGELVSARPDWALFLLGTNDARTQGAHPGKTLVHAEETARNLAELRHRVARETSARCLWITPPAVDEALVAQHPGLARFGVRFRNQDLERVARLVTASDAPVIDAFAALGSPPPAELLLGDGLHLTLAGQKRLALEVLRGWSGLA